MKINGDVRRAFKFSLWCSKEVISWFTTNQGRSRARFTQFEVVGFYRSISKGLLIKAHSFTRNFTEISDRDMDFIRHARKTMLFNKDSTWIKQLQVAMGAYESTDV